MQEKFKIEGPYIELIQLLKVQGIAQTGGHAKLIVEEGVVYRNGEIEMKILQILFPKVFQLWVISPYNCWQNH